MTSVSGCQIWITAFAAEPPGVGGRNCENVVAEKNEKLRRLLTSVNLFNRCHWLDGSHVGRDVFKVSKEMTELLMIVLAVKNSSLNDWVEDIEKGGVLFLSVEINVFIFWPNPLKPFVLQQA